MLRLDINLVLTMINLVVLYLLMKKFLFGPVNAIIQKRQEMIEQQMAAAARTESKALELKSQYEASLQSAEKEKEKLVFQAKADAQKEYERILESADKKAEKILETAQADAEAERKKILHRAESEITEMVISAAAKVVTGQCSEQSDQALYDTFIEKAGDSIDTVSN